MRSEQGPAHRIGTLSEGPLHTALKVWYAQPGDQLKVVMDGFVVDSVRGDLLVEIQMASFSSIKQRGNAILYARARDQFTSGGQR